jgi:hypothetical protein
MTNCATSRICSPLDPLCILQPQFHTLITSSKLASSPSSIACSHYPKARRTHVFIHPRSVPQYFPDESRYPEYKRKQGRIELSDEERREALFSRSKPAFMAAPFGKSCWAQVVRGLSPEARWECVRSQERQALCVSFECDSLNAETEEKERQDSSTRNSF